MNDRFLKNSFNLLQIFVEANPRSKIFRLAQMNLKLETVL